MLNHYDFYNEVNVMKVLLHLMITTFKLKKTEILFFQSIKQTLTIAKL
jgi:hypothetical protein